MSFQKNIKTRLLNLMELIYKEQLLMVTKITGLRELEGNLKKLVKEVKRIPEKQLEKALIVQLVRLKNQLNHRFQC